MLYFNFIYRLPAYQANKNILIPIIFKLVSCKHKCVFVSDNVFQNFRINTNVEILLLFWENPFSKITKIHLSSNLVKLHLCKSVYIAVTCDFYMHICIYWWVSVLHKQVLKKQYDIEHLLNITWKSNT